MAKPKDGNPALLADPATYYASAIERGGSIFESEVLDNGVVKTTFKFELDGKNGTEDYRETVYTAEPFEPVAEPLPESVAAVANALSSTGETEALEEAHMDGMDEMRRDQTHYTDPLRGALVKRHNELQAEIARLARLTESAMKADSAIMSALSSLDRDGV